MTDLRRDRSAGDRSNSSAGLGSAWLAARRGASGLTDARVDGLSRPSTGTRARRSSPRSPGPTTRAAARDELVVAMAPPAEGTFRRLRPGAAVAGPDGGGGGGRSGGRSRVETDTRWLGAPFIVMPRVEGHIIGALAHRDRWLRGLAPGRAGPRLRRLPGHPGRRSTGPMPGAAPAVPRRDNAAELDFWEEYLSWSTRRSAGAGPGRRPGLVPDATARPTSRRPRCCGATSGSRTRCIGDDLRGRWPSSTGT